MHRKSVRCFALLLIGFMASCTTTNSGQFSNPYYTLEKPKLNRSEIDSRFRVVHISQKSAKNGLIVFDAMIVLEVGGEPFRMPDVDAGDEITYQIQNTRCNCCGMITVKEKEPGQQFFFRYTNASCPQRLQWGWE